MQTTSDSVFALTETQVTDAVNVLVPAFLGDPIFNHYYLDRQVRSKVFELLFNDIIRGQLRSKSAFAVADSGELSAVAVWMPPHPLEPDLADQQRGELTVKRLRALDASAADHILAGFEGLQAFHPQEPHWYLMFVGVHPDFQRQGKGALLLQHVHQQADLRGIPCYLETPFPETRPFYASLGYNVTREMRAFGDAPPLWTMLRSAN